MKNKFSLIVALLAFTLSNAQKKELTLEKAVLGGMSEFATENIEGLQWINGTDYYSFVEKNTLYKSSVTSQEKQELISLSTLNLNLLRKLKSFPRINWLTDDQFYFRSGNEYIFHTISQREDQVLPFDENAENIDLHLKSINFAFTVENNLLIKRGAAKHEYISTENDKGIVFGKSVHRNEFGINKGTFWSPNGTKLAFYRMDETMVTDYPLVNMNPVPAEVNLIKYPMAGMASHHVTVGVYDLASKSTVYLKTGEPKEQYLTCVSWSPDEKYVFVGILNRDQNHLKMNQYDAKTGDFIKTLFEEKDEQFVEPDYQLIFIPNQNNQFLWFSSRDNYRQLYLYDLSGKFIKKVTNGEWDVTEFLGFDKDNNFYFEAATNFALERQIFMSNSKGKQTQLTKKEGTHQAVVNNNGYFFDIFSNITTPKTITLSNNKNSVNNQLLNSVNPLEDYAFSAPELIKLTNKAGMQLNARMIKPSNFNPAKKYPVVVYLYGGSHAQMVQNSWLAEASLWMFHLAEKGYIIFTLDNRGSHNRSMDFEQATHRKLGDVEMEDQIVGIDYLKSLPYVNADKMAIHGWSFGGFMTTSFMLRNPDVFKVGVAGGPVIDWRLYEIMYGERYMDTPEQNPEGYKTADLTNHIGNLKGDLLIIHGQVDDVVVPQHSMKLLKAAVDKGVQIDFFTYPGHPHNVRGKDRVHLMDKVIRYIEENLN